MKGLSIEEKARRYDKALERANKLKETCDSNAVVGWMEYIFPELKESGDIRKRIIDALHGDVLEMSEIKDATTWLEKQGNNMGISETTKQELEDNLNKALEKETPESWNEFLEKQGEQKMKTPEESLGIDSDTYNKIVDECIYGEQKPAELPKGEDYGIDGLYAAIDILQKTLGEVDGYQSDDGILTHKCAISAVKELSKQKPTDKIESRQEELTEFEKAVKQVMEEAIECGDTHNLKADADMLIRLVQKPAWSEEDEAKLKSILFHIEDVENKDVIDWFKSLKDRVQPKQEWSENDIKNLNRISTILVDASEVKNWWKEYRLIERDEMIRLTDFLKSLKKRYTCRTSDLPHWKKSSLPNDYTTGFNSDYFCYKGYNINYKELFKKLPKDD